MGMYLEDETRRRKLRTALALAILTETERRCRAMEPGRTHDAYDRPIDAFAIASSIFDHEEAAWEEAKQAALGPLANDEEAGEPVPTWQPAVVEAMRRVSRRGRDG